MKLKTTTTKKRASKRRRVPSPKTHTTESFNLHYEDLHSARRFKPLHFLFLSIAFLVVAASFSIVLLYGPNDEVTAEQSTVIESR